MKYWILLIIIPLLWFGGGILATIVTYKLDDEYPGSKKPLITCFIGILMMALSIIIAGINGYVKF